MVQTLTTTDTPLPTQYKMLTTVQEIYLPYTVYHTVQDIQHYMVQTFTTQYKTFITTWYKHSPNSTRHTPLHVVQTLTTTDTPLPTQYKMLTTVQEIHNLPYTVYHTVQEINNLPHTVQQIQSHHTAPPIRANNYFCTLAKHKAHAHTSVAKHTHSGSWQALSHAVHRVKSRHNSSLIKIWSWKTNNDPGITDGRYIYIYNNQFLHQG